MFEQGALIEAAPGQEPPAAELVAAAGQTITALREQNAIMPWHELDCAIVLETARGVTTSKGIAKSQMITALLAARAKLPEPYVAETDESVQMEADRELAWFAAHGQDADPAAVPDAQEPASV